MRFSLDLWCCRPTPVGLIRMISRFFRTFGARISRSYTPLPGLDSDSFYPVYKTLALSKSNLARPYICRLSNFNRLTCPSTCPLLHSVFIAARTAASSRRKPLAKFLNSTTPLPSTALNHPSNSGSSLLRSNRWNSRAKACAVAISG